MPIYTYECKKCLAKFEEIVPISDYEKQQKCPQCGEMSSQIFPVPTTFQFKLMGWGWSNDGYDGVTKKWKNTRNVFNKDGTLKDRDGDKRDWDNEPVIVDQKPKTDKGPKPGRVRTERK